MLHARTTNEHLALLIGAGVVLFNTFATTIAWLLVSQEKIVLAAALNIISGTTTTVAVFALVAVAHLGTSGAMIASGLGCAAILIPLVWALARQGISFKPVWNAGYLRAAVRFGAAVQLANLLVQMTGRLDLILVYRIGGSASAGRYSVALTLGALVGSIPMAIAFASFPRLPKVTEAEAPGLIASLFRMGVAASIVCTVVLAALSPFFLTLVFGSAYRGALVPSLILLPGGALWSGQWILTRAAAARGMPRSLFVSFTFSFVIMIALDLVLIRPWGIIGAAAASCVSSALGFVISVVFYLRSGGDWRPLVPRYRDAALMITTVREMVASARGNGRGADAEAPVPSSSVS
jgi:O-antigen/teichoic acid export membrane protein